MRILKTFFKNYWLAILVVICDQLTKLAAQHFLILSEAFRIFPFLNFTLAYNNGAAFSFLGGATHWQVYVLSVISLIVSIFIFIYLWESNKQNSRWIVRIQKVFSIGAHHTQWTWITLNLLLGGAVGNLIDRLFKTKVTDFIDFHLGAWHFAAFNVADSAVSIAAVLLAIQLLFFAESNH